MLADPTEHLLRLQAGYDIVEDDDVIGLIAQSILDEQRIRDGLYQKSLRAKAAWMTRQTASSSSTIRMRTSLAQKGRRFFINGWRFAAQLFQSPWSA